MIPEQEFVEKTYKQLSTLGFNKSNTIPCVGLCRDELVCEGKGRQEGEEGKEKKKERQS